MSRKLVLLTILIVFLVSLLGTTLKVQRVEATGTIYVRADGSIDPSDAPISSLDNVTYTFTADIDESIVVERDNIVVDGVGFTLQGTGAFFSKGMDLTGRSNVTIRNTNIKAFWCGIWLETSSDNSISGNTITNNDDGIWLLESSNNTISENIIAANDWHGISLFGSSNYNRIYGNNITTNNWYGVGLLGSSNNEFYHNNFIDNGYKPHIDDSYNNTWDNGYPSGGNYWSNYTGADFHSGWHQSEDGSDGIEDAPYIIDVDNQDRYPLIAPVSVFDAGIWNGKSCRIHVVSNSTVSNFHLNETEKMISFNVTGETGLGFCRVTTPNVIVQDFWQGNYTVLVDGEAPIMMNNWTHGAYTYVYFTYQHSEHEVIIIPEFPHALILLLFMIATLLTVIVYRCVRWRI